MPKDMKAAFGNSLDAENKSILSRFERAEAALARSDAPVSPAGASPTHAAAAAAATLEEETRVKRDSFTMPMSEYELIASLQKKCLRAQVRANKSEILRAGLQALDALSEADLAQLIEALPKVKTGRPPTNVV